MSLHKKLKEIKKNHYTFGTVPRSNKNFIRTRQKGLKKDNSLPI
jgi:hypothetical protein